MLGMYITCFGGGDGGSAEAGEDTDDDRGSDRTRHKWLLCRSKTASQKDISPSSC